MTTLLDLPKDIWFIIFDILLKCVCEEIINDEPRNFFWHSNVHNEKKSSKKVIIKNSCGIGRTCRIIYTYLMQFKNFVDNAPAESQFERIEPKDEYVIDISKYCKLEGKNIEKAYFKGLAQQDIFKDPNGRSGWYPRKNKDVNMYDQYKKIVILRGKNSRPISAVSLLVFKRYFSRRTAVFIAQLKSLYCRGRLCVDFYLCEGTFINIIFDGLFKGSATATMGIFTMCDGQCFTLLISAVDCYRHIEKYEFIQTTYGAVFAEERTKKKLNKFDRLYGRNTVREIGFTLLDYFDTLQEVNAADFNEFTIHNIKIMIKGIFERD